MVVSTAYLFFRPRLIQTREREKIKQPPLLLLVKDLTSSSSSSATVTVEEMLPSCASPMNLLMPPYPSLSSRSAVVARMRNGVEWCVCVWLV